VTQKKSRVKNKITEKNHTKKKKFKKDYKRKEKKDNPGWIYPATKQ
jgi:hypothetical protein